MAASPVVTCAGLLTSAGIRRTRLGSHGAVMWSACVCVCVMRFVLAFRPGVCASPSCRSGRVHVGLECVRLGERRPSYTMFSGCRSCQKPSRTTQITFPLHQSPHLHLSILTAPRLIQFFAYESFLVHVFISETLSLPFLVIRRLQLSIVGKVEEEENR